MIATRDVFGADAAYRTRIVPAAVQRMSPGARSIPPAIGSLGGVASEAAGGICQHPGRSTCAFVGALAFYALESVVVPVTTGRDVQTYIVNYLQLGDWKASVPIWVDADAHAPSTPFLGVPLERAAPARRGPGSELLFAASITAWSCVTCRVFGGRAPPSATAARAPLLSWLRHLFHQMCSDAVSALAFSGWAVLVGAGRRAALHLAFRRGRAGAASLTLVRPTNQLLVLRCSTRTRSSPSARNSEGRLRRLVFIAAAAAPRRMGRRTTDFATTILLASGGQANLVFGRAFVTAVISPETAPHRQTAGTPRCKRGLLPQKSRTVRTGLRPGVLDIRITLRGCSWTSTCFPTESWGWDSDYAILEAGPAARLSHDIRAKFARGVVSTLVGRDEPAAVRLLPHPFHGRPSSSAKRFQPRSSDSAPLPPPTEGEPFPHRP